MRDENDLKDTNIVHYIVANIIHTNRIEEQQQQKKKETKKSKVCFMPYQPMLVI